MEDINIFIGKLGHDSLKNHHDSESFCTDRSATIDSLNMETQVLSKYIGKEILTGDEEWFYSEIKKTYYYNQFNKIIVSNNSAKMMCNYFSFSNDDNPKWGQFCNGLNQEIHFNFDNGEKGIENFRKWLKEKYNSSMPVEVYYVMQYPEIICKRFYYNSNPRFKGTKISAKSNSGNLDPIVSVKKEIDLENNSSIYLKNRNI